MIATIIFDDHGPALRLGSACLDDLGLHAGQRVRLDIQPIPMAPRTPLMEPDGSGL